jgi:hypothetical protein
MASRRAGIIEQDLSPALAPLLRRGEKSMYGRILIGWGLTVFVLAYVAFCIVMATEAFTMGGWGGLVLAIAFLSAVPSLVLGAVLQR